MLTAKGEKQQVVRVTATQECKLYEALSLCGSHSLQAMTSWFISSSIIEGIISAREHLIMSRGLGASPKVFASLTTTNINYSKQIEDWINKRVKYFFWEYIVDVRPDNLDVIARTDNLFFPGLWSVLKMIGEVKTSADYSISTDHILRLYIGAWRDSRSTSYTVSQKKIRKEGEMVKGGLGGGCVVIRVCGLYYERGCVIVVEWYGLPRYDHGRIRSTACVASAPLVPLQSISQWNLMD